MLVSDAAAEPELLINNMASGELSFLRGGGNQKLWFHMVTYLYLGLRPIPVSVRPKAWVCCRSPAGIAGSNPAAGMDICLSVVCCQVEDTATG